MAHFQKVSIYYGCKRKAGSPESKQPKSLNRQWFIHWNHLHPSGQWRRVRLYGNINRYHTIDARMEEARQLLAATTDLLHQGWSPFPVQGPVEVSPAVMPLSEALQWAFSKKVGSLRPATITYYRGHLNILLQAADAVGISFMPLPDVKRKHIKLLLETAATIRNLSANTLNKLLVSAGVFWGILIEWEKAETNPCRDITRLPRVEKSIFTIITPEERAAISSLLSISKPGFFLFVSLIRHLGIRRTEATLLRVGYIDRKAHTITVPAHISKNKRLRLLPLLPAIDKLLDAHLSEASPDDYMFSKDFLPGNTRIHPDTASHTWNKYVKGLLGINKEMYALKHTGASEYIDKGAAPASVSSLLGHGSLDVTRQHYAGAAMASAASKDITKHSNEDF